MKRFLFLNNCHINPLKKQRYKKKQNNSSINSFHAIKKLNNILNNSLRLRLAIILIALIVSSITELLSIASVIPIVNIFANGISSLPRSVQNLTISISSLLSISHSNFILISSIILVLISGLLRALSNFYILKSSADVGIYLHNLSIKNYFSLPFYQQQGKLLDKLPYSLSNQVNQVVNGFIVPIFTALSNVLLFSMLSISLFLLTPKISLIFILIIGSSYFIMSKIHLSYLQTGSQYEIDNAVIHLNILNGIKSYLRPIKIFNLASDFNLKLQIYHNKIRRFNLKKNFIGIYPKIIIETLVLLSLLIYCAIFFSDPSKLLTILPSLAFTVVVIQKLLPLFQGIYNSWTNINANYYSVYDICKYCELKNKKINKEFKSINSFEKISIDNISFSYPESQLNIFNTYSLEIKSRNDYHLTSPSGTGKSTLIDLILGLQIPHSGSIDYIYKDQSYSSTILEISSFASYVPQSTYFFDGKIKDIITYIYPHEKIPNSKIYKALQIVDMEMDQYNNKLNLEKFTSNNMSEFSGGQKQRFAICQALLNPNLKLLVLDETLSMVDSDTSIKILKNIKERFPSLTTILVSHDSSFVPDYFKKIIF